MPSLPRLTALNAALSLPLAPAMLRVESPAGGSTLITRAPMSASNIAQYGPGHDLGRIENHYAIEQRRLGHQRIRRVVTFNRPEARNALTWDMYDALVEACDTAEAAGDVRVLIIRGSGGAFAAGTDISQFREFANGDAGVAYERRLDAVIDRIERLPIADDRRSRRRRRRRRLRHRDGVRPADLLRARAVWRAGVAHARQLPVDGQHRAHGRPDRAWR